MTVQLVLTIVALVLLAVAIYLFGFTLGRYDRANEIVRLRQQGNDARRQVHSLTKQAFVAMAEEVERHRYR